MADEQASAVELAALWGVTERLVRDLAQRGVIQRTGRGRYDRRKATLAYCAHLREQAAGRGGDAEVLTERRREARARAEKVELHNAKSRGDLVSREDVARTWTAIVVDVRAALLAVPTRIPELPKTMARRVDEEIRQALEGLAKNA
ncbi:hypothetical protein V5F59_05740 [Xanthobacter autotrophicus DSM 431]|uniref:hypothetical protein n=1 Tax=Xanthobacter nonsaccharivorans TaxID=3119912 RepID=UPI0037265FAF